MLNILNKTSSVANHFLYEMRHTELQKDRQKFRNNLRRLGSLMAFEISKSLDYNGETVETPLGSQEIMLLSEQPVIISVLRAAVPFAEGVIDIFDQADVGFIGAYRKEDGDHITVSFDYMAVPHLEGRLVIMVDPMLATGKSIVESVENLLKHGTPGHLHIVAAVAAPEGVQHINKSLNIEHTIWTAALDEKLNDASYIVPGLGDAGDLCFGPKL